MKKTFIFAAILLAVATTITIVSCKKDKQEEKVTKNVNLTENEQEKNMDDYLLSFKNKLQNATKNGDAISFEQAERDLGNLLNFDFGDANYATNEIRYDTLHASFLMTDKNVYLYQLNFAYQSLFEQIVKTYQQIDLPEKSVYSIICSFDKKRSDDMVDVTAVLGTRSYTETSQIYLDWRAGNQAGTCDNILIGCYGAPEQVVAMLRANLGTYACEDGERVYFTNEGVAYKEATENDMIDYNAPRGRKLFYEYSSNPNANLEQTCVPYDEIVYYYNQARYLKQTLGSTFHPNPIPSNHVVTDYWIYFVQSLPYNGISAWWKIHIWHAKLNCTNSSPVI
jgi:hypothetical protein